MASLALALGGAFLVSSQAFANYWFVVMGLSLLALATQERSSEESAAPAQGALATAR